MHKTQQTNVGSKTPDRHPAMGWAERQFETTSIQRVSNHSWAKTYRLRGPSRDAYLKFLPSSDQNRNQAIAEIARAFVPHVPSLVAAETDRGYFMFDSHNGQEFSSKLTTTDKTTLLALYGKLQGKARSQPALLHHLPKIGCADQLDALQDLMRDAARGEPTPRWPGNPFRYMRASTVRKYAQVFDAAAPVLRDFLATGDTLAPTLNHCDLRAKNIARRDDGSLCIFDWDDAVQAPPGVSLHAQFSGCTRVFAAFDGQPQGKDMRPLQAYVDALVTFGGYDREELRSALPATAAAGVMRYVHSFAAYAVTSETSQASIKKNVRRRMSDLMDLIVLIAARHPAQAGAVSRAFAATGRSSRAQALANATPRPKASVMDVQDLIKRSDAPEVFPTVEISEAEHQSGKMSSDTRTLAETLFKRHGGLMIKDAFGADQIDQMREEFDALRTQHEAAIDDGGALRVGDKRFMISMELKGAFAAPNVIASPFVLPVLHRLLSKDAILGSFTAVASMPGSKDQSLHRDNPPLFEEQSTLETPSFCIALIIPLIALDETTGATRIIKGSHRKRTAEAKTMPVQDPVVDLGSCYLMDSRLFHQGMANNSDRVRPILSLVYQRPWYRDHKNFKKQSPLMMSDAQRKSFPREMRKLVAWAGEPN